MRPTLSFFALLVIYTAIFLGFLYYDWGFPITKAVLFLFMAVIVWRLRMAEKPQEGGGAWAAWIEGVTCVLFILLAVVFFTPKAIRCADQSFFTESNQMAQRSAEILFRQGGNPYLELDMPIERQDPKYTGFKYGPVMLAGYALSAFGGVIAYKASQFVYFILSWLLVVALASRIDGVSTVQKLSAALFAAALYMAPERFWYEVFARDANDMFSIFLLIASIYLFARDRIFLAGLLAGLSFSAKIFPAYCWALLLFRDGYRRKFYSGFLIGLLPMAAFLMWSPQAFLDSVFVFHMFKNYDSTSLYSILPGSWHWVFPALQCVFTITILWYSYRKNYSLETVTGDLLLLMIAAQLFYREVHANHLINFVPILAFFLAWKRYSLFTKRVI